MKDGLLYNVQFYGIYAEPLSMEEVMGKGEKYSIVIDDRYFFYVYVGKIGAGGKKVRNMISNYLQSFIPIDIMSDFAVFENKGSYTALLYTSAFGELVESNKEFFSKAKQISTVLCELLCRYNTFVFTDGEHIYEKDEDHLEILAEPTSDTIKADDLRQDLLPLRGDISINDVQKAKEPLNNLKVGAIVVGVCYIVFLLANIMQLQIEKKDLKAHSQQLEDYYVFAGVANTGDPYGVLLSRAGTKKYSGFRVYDILYNMGNAVKDVKLEALTINDKSVRIEGFAQKFADMEYLKVALEKGLKKTVTVDDSRQIGSQIKFSMRFEP